MRLTNEIRDHIVKKAMSAAFDRREKALEKAKTKLADSAYAHEFGAIAKIADKLPENWVHTSSLIYIECPGFVHWNDSDSPNNRLPMSKTRRVPRYQSSDPVKITPSHPLYDQAQAVADEHRAISTEKTALKAKLQSIVYSVTTIPKLLDIWPECKPYMPELAQKTGAIVPVELIPQVNAALGLAKKEAA